MNSAPKVGVALLNWNGYADTAVCLASLRASEFRPARILVFDNGSTDGSADRLAAEFPEIELVRAGENLGFAEGNDRAAQALLDAGMDYVWILNNDTRVEAGCLGALVAALESDPALGAAGAKIWFMDPRKPLCYAGARCRPWTFEVEWRGLWESDAGQYDRPEDVQILSGCCMLVRAETLRRIGLFNREFFAYGEDLDWSLRARAAGIRLRYEPRAQLWHKMFGASQKDGEATVRKSTPRVEYLMTRNFVWVVRQHGRPRSLRRFAALAHLIFVWRVPRSLGLLLLPTRRAVGWAGLRGLRDGLRRRPDPAAGRL